MAEEKQNPTPAPPAPKAASPAAAKAPAPPAPPKVRYANGKLTRFGMEQAIKDGGSVSHEGRTITNIAELPTESEIAKGNKEAEDAAVASLDFQIAQLSAQRAHLTAKK